MFENLQARNVSSSGLLRSVDWYTFTAVSEQRIGVIFKGQEKGTDMFSRNGGKGVPYDAA